MQTCDKGNACLTCSVFVTDESHQAALERQLDETDQLIARSAAAFQNGTGVPCQTTTSGSASAGPNRPP